MGVLVTFLLFSGLEIVAGIWQERREKRKKQSAHNDGGEHSSSQAANSGRKTSR